MPEYLAALFLNKEPWYFITFPKYLKLKVLEVLIWLFCFKNLNFLHISLMKFLHLQHLLLETERNNAPGKPVRMQRNHWGLHIDFLIKQEVFIREM